MQAVINYLDLNYTGGSIRAYSSSGTNNFSTGYFLQEVEGLFQVGSPNGESITRVGGSGSIPPKKLYYSGKVINLSIIAAASNRNQLRDMIGEFNSMLLSHPIILNTDWVGPYTCFLQEDTTQMEWIDSSKVIFTFILKAEEAV